MSTPSGVAVRTLIGARSDALGLGLRLLAGSDGLDRQITSPHIQKTGLALAGFHTYLKAGRVLVFGESEVRYLESLTPAALIEATRLALSCDVPCVLITGGFRPADALVIEAERAAGAVAPDGGGNAGRHRQAQLPARRPPGRA